MLRHLLFALLVAAPSALIAWMVARGMYAEPREPCVGQESAPAATNAVRQPPEDEGLLALLREPIPGATLRGEVALYDRDGLFDYINGAAPLFIERGFRKLAAVEMSAEGGELTCDVYDMNNPDGAKAIYEAEQPPEAEDANIGDQSRKGSMALVFRKERYYVKLTAYHDKAEAALPQIAKALCEKIK